LLKRKLIFDAYSEAFNKFDWAELTPYSTEDKISSFHLFPLRIKGVIESQRDTIIQEIFIQDVSVNVHFTPVPMMSFYKKMGYSIEDYPQSYLNYSREISLPVYYDLSEEQVQIVIKAVIYAVEKTL